MHKALRRLQDKKLRDIPHEDRHTPTINQMIGLYLQNPISFPNLLKNDNCSRLPPIYLG